MKKDSGFTLLEMIVTLTILTIVTLGAFITMIQIKEHLAREDVVRIADEYGNNVIQDLNHQFRNADSVDVWHRTRDIDAANLYYTDKFDRRHVLLIRPDIEEGVKFGNDFANGTCLMDLTTNRDLVTLDYFHINLVNPGLVEITFRMCYIRNNTIGYTHQYHTLIFMMNQIRTI